MWGRFATWSEEYARCAWRSRFLPPSSPLISLSPSSPFPPSPSIPARPSPQPLPHSCYVTVCSRFHDPSCSRHEGFQELGPSRERCWSGADYPAEGEEEMELRQESLTSMQTAGRVSPYSPRSMLAYLIIFFGGVSSLATLFSCFSH